jgi:putative MFS transporter
MNATPSASVALLPYDEAPSTQFHTRVAVAAAGGALSDGYVLGTVGIALSLAHDDLRLDSIATGLIGAASLAGLFLGSLLLGPLADRFGRRPAFLPTMAVFALASAAQFFVQTVWQLLALRLLLGLALGVDYVACTALVAEFAPRRSRGRLLSLLAFAWAVGYTFAYVAGTLISHHLPQPWRWTLLSSAVPATLVLLVRLGIPETPPWLVLKGRLSEARNVISRYIGANIDLPVISAAGASGDGSRWADLFGVRYWRNTLVGAGFYTAQVIPYFAMGTFIPVVLSALHVSDPYASGMVFNGFLMAGSACGLWLIDHLSRRQFLVGSFYIAGLTLMLLTLVPTHRPDLVVGLFAVFAFVLSAAANLEFGYLPELFPTRLRASGVGFATAVSRIGAAASTFLLPLSVERLGVRGTLGVCVAVLVAGGLLCQLLAPETRGRLA